MDREVWSAAVHGVAKSQTRLRTELNWTNLILKTSQFMWTWDSFNFISLLFRIVWFVNAYFYLSQLNRALLQINSSYAIQKQRWIMGHSIKQIIYQHILIFELKVIDVSLRYMLFSFLILVKYKSSFLCIIFS